MKDDIMPFEQASYLMQVRRLREMAIAVIAKYPIKVKRLDFIKYSANAIFKITDTDYKKYMLRISPPNFHTKNAILEEFEWLNCILKSTALSVPKPIYSNKGEYLVEHRNPRVSDIRYCALFEWIEGRHLWKSIDKKYAYRLGALTAQLEESGKQVKSKHRVYWNTEGLVGTEKARYVNLDRLTLKEALYQGYADHISLTQEDIDMIPYFLLTRKLTAISALELRKDHAKLRPWFLQAIERAITFFKSNIMK